MIQVHDKNGKPIKVRALLDSGSQINIMTHRMCNKMGVQSMNASMVIRGIGNSSVESTKRAVIQIESMNSGFKASLEVFVVKQVTTCQPSTKIAIDNWKIPKNVTLADPNFNIPASVDLIIGRELFFKLMSIGMISIGNNLPDLQNTVFGWVVIGKLLGLETNSVFTGVGTVGFQALEN